MDTEEKTLLGTVAFWCCVLVVAFVGMFIGSDPITTSQSKVVEIHVTANGKDGWLGSGAYVSSDGLVLTCAHLFSHDTQFIFVVSPTGQRSAATLVRCDKKADLALLKTYPMNPVSYFTLGSEPNRGDDVYSFGSPLGYQFTVTKGIVENLNVGKDRWTMHGASINPGNSGGPLVSANGHLIGVNVTVFMAPGFMGIPSPAAGMDNAVSLDAIRHLLRD